MTKQYVENEKLVYIISDGIGQSAINLLKASMIQFDFPSSALRIFSRIDNEVRIRTILEQAKEDNAFVAFTIVKGKFANWCMKSVLKKPAPSRYSGPPIENCRPIWGLSRKRTPTCSEKLTAITSSGLTLLSSR